MSKQAEEAAMWLARVAWQVVQEGWITEEGPPDPENEGRARFLENELRDAVDAFRKAQAS